MKIKLMKTAVVLLGALSVVIPAQSLRSAYLRAFYTVWDAETGGLNAVDLAFESDVYNGHPFEWSQRPVPTLVADRLLADYDAAAERDLRPEWEFQNLLEQNLRS